MCVFLFFCFFLALVPYVGAVSIRSRESLCSVDTGCATTAVDYEWECVIETGLFKVTKQ